MDIEAEHQPVDMTGADTNLPWKPMTSNGGVHAKLFCFAVDKIPLQQSFCKLKDIHKPAMKSSTLNFSSLGWAKALAHDAAHASMYWPL